MSSEGSVTSSGSRIRQFGLYRTIDARTEEFLRSSRKRQIRQGCACAAISTAITVTVVVSVILVYEYSINAESNVNKKLSLKPNWVGLMNDSDITSISSKFNKKINFDRTTLKLLPILLKALNKNRYLEKILEDYSSSSSPFTAKDATEATFTRNVFSGSKNWLKMPTARHYNTVDYKTSPLMQWKTPTQRLEYLTKIRKIRDYQRMLNYFDKMINEKVGNVQKKDHEYTENPLMAETQPMIKENIRKKQINDPTEKYEKNKEYKIDGNDNIVSCKCPKKMGQLLNKLITGIQEMVPNMITKKLGLYLCSNDNTDKAKQRSIAPLTNQTIGRKKHKISNTPIPMYSIRSTVSKIKRKLTTFAPKVTNKTTSTTSTSAKLSTSSSTSPSTTTTTSSTTSSTTASTTVTTPLAITTTTLSVPKNAETKTTTMKAGYLKKILVDDIIRLPTTIGSIMYKELVFDKDTLDYDSIVKPVEAPNAKRAKDTEIKRPTTEMFIPIKYIESQEASSTEKGFDAYTVDPYTRMHVPLYKEDEYDDYFVTTSNKPKSEFENIDVKSTEFIKNKIMPLRIFNTDTFKKSSVKLKPSSNHPVVKHKDLDLTSMRKMADMIYLPQEKIAKDWQYTVEPKTSPTTSTTQRATVKLINLNKVKTANSDRKNNFTPETVHEQKLMDHQNSENVVDDELQDEYTIKQPEGTTEPYKYKNTTKVLNADNEKNKQNSAWQLLKNEENLSSKPLNSMLPSMRPIYLEVQRNNEWRQDQDRADYDINFNNNIFDLPNIN